MLLVVTDNKKSSVAKARQAGFMSNAALREACFDGNLDRVKKLVREGAPINTVTYGQTPLTVASHHLEIEKFLLENGAIVDLTDDRFRTTALMLASQQGKAAIVKLLLEHGAKVDAEDYKGRTAIYYAGLFGSMDVMEVLLSYGANVNHFMEDGASALFVPCTNGYTMIVTLLLKNGININKSDADGRTAIYMASSARREDVVGLLMQAGADYSVRTSNSLTPLGIAQILNATDVIHCLQAPIISLLCGHHERCGKTSTLQNLPVFVLVDIAKYFLQFM